MNNIHSINNNNLFNNLFNNIQKLPQDIIFLIKEYIPKKYLIFTNKENYKLYHKLLKPSINNYENYIRDTIRRDNSFVFEQIMNENYKIWKTKTNYMYKNMIFNNYFY